MQLGNCTKKARQKYGPRDHYNMTGSVGIEETERPEWLLKQVRDLTENWEIPLGDELEKYLDQVCYRMQNCFSRSSC